jgi:hypothetical protein
MFSVPLDLMSREEKLKALEAIWQDLTKDGDFESPEWHAHVLRETEQAVKDGKAGFLEWEAAKQKLRNP